MNIYAIVDKYQENKPICALKNKSDAIELMLDLEFENAYISFCRHLIQCQNEIAPYGFFDHKYGWRNRDVMPSDELIAMQYCDNSRYYIMPIKTIGLMEE